MFIAVKQYLSFANSQWKKILSNLEKAKEKKRNIKILLLHQVKFIIIPTLSDI